jgi:hypothetical protein
MSHFPARRYLFLFFALAGLAFLAGCQGFSSAKSPQTPDNNSTQGDLSAAPSTVTFGNVEIGSSQSLSDTVTNTGSANVTISQATFTRSGFTTSGLNLPLTLSAGQSATFNVVFSAQSAGNASATLALSNDGTSSPLNIALSGTGATPDSLGATPTSLSFGNVQLGTGETETETVTNSGGSNLTITQASISSAAFNYTGLTLPVTLAPNQSSTFGIVFNPSATGTSNGTLSLTVDGASSTVDIALSGTGTAAATGATLAAIPISLTFNDLQAGKSQTQTETVQNTGGAIATISSITATGAGFSISGASTPVTLSPGQTTSFNVIFSPLSSGNFSGNIAVASNATDPSLNISLSGSAVTASSGQVNISPSTINVGSVTVGTSSSQTASLSATGASVVVSSVQVESSEFSISGISLPVTIAAGKSVSFTVNFTPQSSGVASSTISFTSNATNSPSSATVTGTGVAAPVHIVNLSWNTDNSPNVTGYNVYRRVGTQGNFSKITASPVSVPSYGDTSVSDSTTYYYETTAINSSGEESSPSAAVQAVIPPP